MSCPKLSTPAWRQLKLTFQVPLGVCRLFPRWALQALRLSSCLGKTREAAGIGPCANLTWKGSELHYWPWKFWQHSTLIFCFIMSNLRICCWCTQLPTHFSTFHWTLEPPLQLWLWQTQEHTPLPQTPSGEREVQRVTANVFPGCHQLAFSRLENWAPSRGHKP